MWLALAKLALQLGGSAVIDALEGYIKDVRAQQAGIAKQVAADDKTALDAAQASARASDTVRGLGADALAARVRRSSGIDYD